MLSMAALPGDAWRCGAGPSGRRDLGTSSKEDRLVDIIISNASRKPIYEQITSQVKELILAGDLKPGDQLPSIRALAADLAISAITTKRAYADLEAAGFIETVQGKGSFVAGGNLDLLREERLRKAESLLRQAVDEARACGVTDGELMEMLELMLGSDDL